MTSSKKVKEVSAKKQDLKPKYIHNLKEAAERRKRENECRIERKVQKEREAEGDMYKDKEVFVTETHRRNLEKMMQLHEDEARMDRLEAIADVTKQPDISGFYRHLYSQTIDKKPVKEEKDSADESADPRATISEPAVNIDRDEDLSVDSDSSERSQSNSESGSDKSGGSKLEPKKSFAKRKRQYRSRNVEESEDESEAKAKVKKSEKKKSRAETEDQTDAEDEAEAESQIEEKRDELSVKVEKDSVEEKERDDSKKDQVEESEVKVEKEKIVEVVKEEKPKVSIWEKRTVGDVFDAALQRYYTRKALRMSS